ncbi:uncharacterized protein Tco025E_04249 [Trypanosoma conorhini]|uniref:Uncharacterized protein n=1 Tax=Trypanosoma conorhini TaxID=83891 RepID=A0A422PMY3_9TRYP|nr:uncharacterized protein Tco025E_04249 [Trypanosoma conorhini]RNF19085.1 hypothetical protein Tco025E_04249 [Trypanosoma conorhini]
MGLLLDDEDFAPPRKVTRVERHVLTPAAGDGKEMNATLQERAEEHNSGSSTNHSGGFSAPLEIPLRGGDGMEKMAAFAFGAERASVKLVDASPPRLRERPGVTASQGSLNSSERQRDSPQTVAKCVMAASQSIYVSPDTLPNTSSGSPMTQGAHSSPSCTPDNAPRSPAVVSHVSRTLFVGAAKNLDTPPAATAGAKGTEAAPRPRVQMKLSDFFTKMACAKK